MRGCGPEVDRARHKLAAGWRRRGCTRGGGYPVIWKNGWTEGPPQGEQASNDLLARTYGTTSPTAGRKSKAVSENYRPRRNPARPLYPSFPSHTLAVMVKIGQLRNSTRTQTAGARMGRPR